MRHREHHPIGLSRRQREQTAGRVSVVAAADRSTIAGEGNETAARRASHVAKQRNRESGTGSWTERGQPHSDAVQRHGRPAGEGGCNISSYPARDIAFIENGSIGISLIAKIGDSGGGGGGRDAGERERREGEGAAIDERTAAS